MNSLWLALLVAAAQDQQLGSRAKAMGGSYTAFEDDPVSIWLNPAGIATQPDQFAIVYQTYPVFEVETVGDANESVPETSWVDPAIVPSYAGLVFQLGSGEDAMAIGICYARPYHIKYPMDQFNPLTGNFEGPNAATEQSLARFRVAFAKDFRLRKSGEAGFLTHVALGGGIDLGYERFEFTLFQATGGIDTLSDNSTFVGFGLGFLAGVYDDGSSFRVNAGAAYQSEIGYRFNLDRNDFPQFDMPQQFNAGVTFYLLETYPLRVTADFQWIDWDATAARPDDGRGEGFEDAFNFSLGVEYRVRVSDHVNLFPRIGYRRFDAPWEDEDDLPVTAQFKLNLDTRDEAFHIFTFGLGVAWTTDAGKVRTVDVAGGVGGDTFNAAFGVTFEM